MLVYIVEVSLQAVAHLDAELRGAAGQGDGLAEQNGIPGDAVFGNRVLRADKRQCENHLPDRLGLQVSSWLRRPESHGEMGRDPRGF
jgi:hypothetical protein